MTFTEQFIEYAKESTDCPPLLLEWAAILALSTVMGRNVYFDYGDSGLYANIWMIIIGPSSMRKSTSLRLAHGLIREVNSDALYSQGWSKEALWQEMASKSNGLFLYDEAKSFFDCCSANYNVGVINDLTTLFGGDTLKRTTKKETFEIIDPFIGFGGASTPEWMIDGIKDKQSAILSGFLPRFLLINAPPQTEHYSWFRKVDGNKKQVLIEKLRSFQQLSGPMRYDDAAARAFEQWDLKMFKKIKQLEQNSVPYVPFLNKMSTLYPHKLAMIAAIDEGTFPIINMKAWTRAERWLQSAEDSLYALLGSLIETSWDKLRQKAVDYLTKKLDCTREEFGDDTRIRGRTADIILTGLQNDGKITLTKMEKTTKPITVIQWVGSSNVDD